MPDPADKPKRGGGNHYGWQARYVAAVSGGTCGFGCWVLGKNKKALPVYWVLMKGGEKTGRAGVNDKKNN